MKKLLISILIVSVVFISGCTSDDQINSEPSTDSPKNLQSNTQPNDLILKPGDFPGLYVDAEFLAVPKNALYVYGDDIELERYRDTLPIGYRNVGEDWGGIDQSGRVVQVTLSKYDSNDRLMEEFDNYKHQFEVSSADIKEKDLDYDIEFGDPSIGDNSYFFSLTDLNTDYQNTNLIFLYKNNSAYIRVLDEKGKSFNEAIQLGKIILSRLN